MLEHGEECPIVSASPDTLEQTLAEVARWSVDRARQCGEAGRAYVARYHSIPAVADRLAQLYVDTAGFPSNVNEMLKVRQRQIRTDLARAA
jgi:hypothetical protein